MGEQCLEQEEAHQKKRARRSTAVEVQQAKIRGLPAALRKSMESAVDGYGSKKRTGVEIARQVKSECAQAIAAATEAARKEDEQLSLIQTRSKHSRPRRSVSQPHNGGNTAVATRARWRNWISTLYLVVRW